MAHLILKKILILKITFEKKTGQTGQSRGPSGSFSWNRNTRAIDARIVARECMVCIRFAFGVRGCSRCIDSLSRQSSPWHN